MLAEVTQRELRAGVEMNRCQICGHADGNQLHVVREMMFGYRDSFEYLECAKCGCLQIKEPPPDLSKYYPDHYYSFRKPALGRKASRALIKHQRAKYCLSGRGWIGLALSKVIGVPGYYEWLKRAKVTFDSAILDVGCGMGQLLLMLREEGFSNLVGVDPLVVEDIAYDNGVKILKRDLAAIEQQFDLIMLHHSFEHMPQPWLILKELYRLLKPDRYLLIRVPVASFAWRHYGVNWMQLDAPRHLFLHTTKSVQLLADQAGFQVMEVIFDSTDLQFWASEQYLKDIPFRDQRSYYENPRRSIFSKEQIEAFQARAVELNNNHDGDQAAFYLYKA